MIATNIQELKMIRKERSITQQQIADFLKISKAYISSIESGKRTASPKLLADYRAALSALSSLSTNFDLDKEQLILQFLSECHETKNIDRVTELEKARTLLANVEGNLRLEAEVYICLSILYRNVSIRDYDTAIEYAKKAVDFYRANQNDFPIAYAEALFELAQIYIRTDQQLVAEEYFIMVNNILERHDPNHLYRYISVGSLAVITSHYGRLHDTKGHLELCEYLVPTVRWTGTKWSEETSDAYRYQMQSLYLYIKANMAEANEDYHFAIETLLTNLEIMRNIKKTFNGWKARELQTIDHIATIYLKIGDYKSAEKYLVQSIQQKEEDDLFYTSYYLDSLNYLTTCYLQTERYDDAIKQAQKIIDFDATGTVSKAIAYRHMGQAYLKRDGNQELYRMYINRAIEVISLHEAYHKLDLYDELLAELMALN